MIVYCRMVAGVACVHYQNDKRNQHHLDVVKFKTNVDVVQRVCYYDFMMVVVHRRPIQRRYQNFHQCVNRRCEQRQRQGWSTCWCSFGTYIKQEVHGLLLLCSSSPLNYSLSSAKLIQHLHVLSPSSKVVRQQQWIVLSFSPYPLLSTKGKGSN